MVNSTLDPALATFFRTWHRRTALNESRPEVGSSKNTNAGRVTNSTPTDERGIGEAFTPEGNGKDILGITRHNVERRDDKKIGIVKQAQLLFVREVANLTRDTHALKARTAMTCVISFVIGFIFYNVAKTSFTVFINVQSCFGALLMALLANVFSTALPSLIAFPDERPVFLREYSTNHYSVFSYFGSRLLMELLVTGVQVTVSSILTYFLVGFSAHYGIFWSGLYLMACASTGTIHEFIQKLSFGLDKCVLSMVELDFLTRSVLFLGLGKI